MGMGMGGFGGGFARGGGIMNRQIMAVTGHDMFIGMGMLVGGFDPDGFEGI